MNTYMYAEVDNDGKVNGIMHSTINYIKLDDSAVSSNNIENYWYDFDTETFVSKSELTYELEIDGLTATFTGLPSDLFVLINGWFTDRTGEDVFVVNFDDEGSHVIAFSNHTKFFDKEITIEIE